MLSFGPWAPGHINPLDGDLVTTDNRKFNFFRLSNKRGGGRKIHLGHGGRGEGASKNVRENYKSSQLHIYLNYEHSFRVCHSAC